MQQSASQQILEELNSKCSDYEDEIQRIKLEKDDLLSQIEGGSDLPKLQPTKKKSIFGGLFGKNKESESEQNDEVKEENAANQETLESLKKSLESTQYVIDGLKAENKKLSAMQSPIANDNELQKRLDALMVSI